jgi:hypothetical protein
MGAGKSKDSKNAFCDEDDNKLVDIPNLECFCVKNSDIYYNKILIFIIFFIITFIISIQFLRRC